MAPLHVALAAALLSLVHAQSVPWVTTAAAHPTLTCNGTVALGQRVFIYEYDKFLYNDIGDVELTDNEGQVFTWMQSYELWGSEFHLRVWHTCGAEWGKYQCYDLKIPEDTYTHEAIAAKNSGWSPKLELLGQDQLCEDSPQFDTTDIY